MSEYESPIIMERARVEIDPVKEPGEMFDMVEVRRADNRALLATCMMSDETGLERIADRLSAMRLWREANRFRMMVQESRRGIRR